VEAAMSSEGALDLMVGAHGVSAPARCPSAVPMLRWAHDRHRDLHPLESAQGAAASAKPNREDSFVTRHGLNHAWAAATALRPTAHLMPDVINCDPTLSFDHHSSTINRHAARQYRNEAISQTCRGDGRTVPRIGQKSYPP
jgi:hypothetical protein